jgi:carbon monoxide dehydrogenase subunit G
LARYVDAIDLPIPTDEAFRYLADFSRTAEWDPSVVAAERLTPGEIGVGSRFRVTLGFAGKHASLEYEITTFEPPTRLVLRGANEQLESIDEVSFVPRGDGTRVTYEARIELRGLRRLADPLLDAVFQHVGRLATRGLRERIHEIDRRKGPAEPPNPSQRGARPGTRVVRVPGSARSQENRHDARDVSGR